MRCRYVVFYLYSANVTIGYRKGVELKMFSSRRYIFSEVDRRFQQSCGCLSSCSLCNSTKHTQTSLLLSDRQLPKVCIPWYFSYWKIAWKTCFTEKLATLINMEKMVHIAECTNAFRGTILKLDVRGMLHEWSCSKVQCRRYKERWGIWCHVKREGWRGLRSHEIFYLIKMKM